MTHCRCHNAVGLPLRTVVAWLMGIVAMLPAACSSGGPDLAEVRGTVKLDGTPLVDALVTYWPSDGTGTYSSAMTDLQGQYRLLYNRSRSGVLLGTHKVTIMTAPPGGGGIEKVPPRYNSKTELVQDVGRGSHVIDFDLESKGTEKGRSNK